MFRGKWLIGLILAGFLMPNLLLTRAQTLSFDRNLSLGSVGEDVRLLQKELNQNPLTQLAQTGPGSPGQETNYFGPLTRSAVKKYQELHFDQILKPAGLTEGTGFFGPLTRAVFNRLLADVPATSPASVPEATAVSHPTINSISPASGKTATRITISGSDGKTLEVAITSNVPAEALQSVPDLPVYFYVKNENGRSDEIKFTLITE